MKRLLRPNSEGLKADYGTAATNRIAHDFTGMPIYARAPIEIQMKVKVNTPGDIYEQEADRVATHVMNIPERSLQRACHCGGECAQCKAKHLAQGHGGVQRKAARSIGISETSVPTIVDEVLHSTGRPLDTNARDFFEARFGYDFSSIRVHSDSKAAASAEALSASAYTVGTHIAFGAGRFAPGTYEGRWLLAHELTHVVQQLGGNGMGIGRRIDDRDLSSVAPISSTSPEVLRRHTTADCDTAQSGLVATAIATAKSRLEIVIAELGKSPLTADMENALWIYFRDSSRSTAASVFDNLKSILSIVGELTYECENDCDTEELGYTRLGTMVTGLGHIHLCMNSLEGNADEISETIIHEVAHYVLLADDSFGYYGSSCEESETTVAAVPSSKLSLADSYNCIVANWISGNATDRANAKGDLSGTNIAGITQSPPGPVDLDTASRRMPLFSMKLTRGPLATITGVSYRWILRAQDQSFLMTNLAGNDLFQFKPAADSVTAIINLRTRRLLKEKGITSGRVVCRATSPVFGEKLFEIPVSFV